MLKKNPLVSIIMSVHNSEETIERCIKSILAQTYKNFEFIITDDASIDSSLNIIYKYAKKDLRIYITKNEQNIGLTESLIKSINICKGDIIARIDSDEYAKPSRIEKQVKRILKNDISVLGSKCINLYKNKKKITLWPYYSVKEINKLLKFKSPFAHGTSMFLKKDYIKIGGYNRQYKTSQDLDLWQRFYEIGKVEMLDDFLSYRYITTKSISHNNKLRQFIDTTVIRFKNSRNKDIGAIILYSIFSLLISYLPLNLFFYLQKNFSKRILFR